MSDQNSLLISVKQEVRSLLLAEKAGLSLSQFLRDYKTFVGRQLPYAQLGYNRAEDFLFSIRDAVSLRYSQFGEPHLTAVSDESTRHIEKLVQKQKSKNIPRSFSSRLHQKYNLYQYPYNTFQPQHYGVRSTPPRRTPSPFVFVKPSIKIDNKISSVSKIEYKSVKKPLSNDVDATKSVVNKETASENIKLSNNFNSHSKNSKSETEVSTISLRQLKDRIISIVTANDKGIGITELQLSYKTKFDSSLNYKAHGFDSLESCLEEIEGLQPRNINGILKIFCRNESKNDAMINSPKPQSEIETEKNIQNSPSNPLISSARSISHEIETSFPPKISEASLRNSVTDMLKNQFHEILKRNPSGITDQEFLRAYKAIYSNDLNFKGLGYKSVIDLVKSLPDVFAYCQYPDLLNVYLLFDAASEITEKLVQPPTNEKVELHSATSLDTIISTVRKILQANSDGVYIDDFFHIYSLNTEKMLNLNDLGFDSLTKFFLAIKDKVPLKFNYSNVRTKVCLAYDSFSNPSSVVISSAPFPEIPSDAILPGGAYTSQSLPILPKGEFFPVYVGCVLTPNLIYIQLKGPETSGALTVLANKFENFYGTSACEQYTMQPQHIVIGAVCAAVWDSDSLWYRATIVAIDIHHVNVTFVDYGNSAKVSKKMLRYLTKDFFSLPAQAIKTRMACIAPIEEEWNIKARELLLKHCIDKLLMCEVVQSKLQNDISSIWLCDTLGSEDKHINLLLIQEGLAVSVDEKTQFRPPPDKDAFMKAIWTIVEYQKAVSSVSNSLYGYPNLYDQALPSNVPISQPLSIINPNCFFPSFPYPNYSVPQSTNNFPSASNMIPNLNTSSNPSESLSINPPTSISLTTTSATLDSVDELSSSNEEVFDSDLEDDFYQTYGRESVLEKNIDVTTKKRFVLRVNLQLGYKIHIVVVNNRPYITTEDVVNLFWPSENGTVLQRRLQQNNVYIPTITISIEEHPLIFEQLKWFKVSCGLLNIALFRLKDLNIILNVFGHPSRSIRSEVKRELLNFDSNSDIWKYFSEFPVSEDTETFETDSNKLIAKFNRLCVYDLKASLEGLGYKQKKLQKDLNSNSSSVTLRESEKLKNQCLIYEKRIQEIEGFCQDR